MVTLKEAHKIAEETFQGEVVGTGDCGRYWGFGSDGWILLVDKESGDAEFVLPAFFAQSLDSGAITYRLIDYLEGT